MAGDIVRFAPVAREPAYGISHSTPAVLGTVGAVSFAGSPGGVRGQMQDFGDRTKAAELIAVSHNHDHAARRRSYEIVAQAMNLS